MNFFDTEFHFKGDRNYVHGTDIVDNLFSVFPAACNLRFKFLQPTLYNGRMFISSSSAFSDISLPPYSFCTVSGSFILSNEPVYFTLYHDPSLLIKSSYPFVENNVLNRFSYPSATSLAFTTTNNFTFIEQLVVAMKFLCLKSSNALQWRFASLAINTLDVLPASSLSLNMTRSVANKLRSDLY